MEGIYKKKKIISMIVVIVSLALIAGAIYAAGGASTTINIWTLANIPSLVEAEVLSDTSAKISWAEGENEKADGGPYYKLYLTTDQGELSAGAEDPTSWTQVNNVADLTQNSGNEFTVSGLLANTEYYAKIETFNGNQEKTDGQDLLLTEAFLTLPTGFDADYLALVTNGQEVGLSWVYPVGANNLKTKIIYSANDSASWNDLLTSEESETSYAHEDLVPATKYSYKLAYVNDTGAGGESVEKAIFTDAKVGGDILVTERKEDGFKLTLNNNPNINGNTQYKFAVYKDDVLVPGKETAWLDNATFDFTDLDPGLYEVRLSFKNNHATSTDVIVGDIRANIGTKPGEPGLIAVPGSTASDSITVKLSPNNNQVENIQFILTISSQSLPDIPPALVTITEDDMALDSSNNYYYQHTFTGLRANTKYQIKGDAMYVE